MEYQILDDEGVIHSSKNEEEMNLAFDCMTNPNECSPEDVEIWKCSFSGDLKLIKLLRIAK